MRVSCLLGLVLVVGWAPLQAEVVDQVVRYINKEIITQGELMERAQLRAALLRRDGGQPPRSEREIDQFLLDTLEEITDEILLLQEATRLKVEIDERPVRRELRERARALGRPLQLDQAREAIDDKIKLEMMKAVMEFYSRGSSTITPSDLQIAYEERQDDFRRPVRRKLLRILRRPATKDDHKRVTNALLEVFRGAQEASQPPAIRAAVTEEARKAYIAARKNPEEQLAVLAGVAENVLGAVVVDHPEATHALASTAQNALQSIANLVSLEEIEVQLQAVVEEISALPDAAARHERFAALARTISDGPRAPQGGDLDWTEPGGLGDPYDSEAAKLAVGAVSEVFAAGDARCLIFMADREASTVRGLAEVSAELRKQLQRDARDKVRVILLARLRERASIEDLDALTKVDLESDVLDNARFLSGGAIETVVEDELRNWGVRGNEEAAEQ